MTDPQTESTTTTLTVEAATADQLRALIGGPDRFRDEFGLTVVDGYLEFPDALAFWLDQVVRDGTDPAWWTHLVVHPGDRALIGLAGYKGPPVDGTVELGYGIAPAYRGAGYATEAARVLIDPARDAGVTTVIAHTLAATNASTRVLERNDFVWTDTVDDPEDGPIWRWEKELTTSR